MTSIADPAASVMQSVGDPAVCTLQGGSPQRSDGTALSQPSTMLLEDSKSAGIPAGTPTAADLLPDPSYDPWDLPHDSVSPGEAEMAPSIPSDLPTVLTK